MKIRTIATLMTTALLFTAFVPALNAQEREMPGNVEVITITAKRPASILAALCSENAEPQADAASAENAELHGNIAPAHDQQREAATLCTEQIAANEG